MRDLSSDFEEEGSEMGNGSFSEGGDDGLLELTAEYLRSEDTDVVGRLWLSHFGNIVRYIENRHQHQGLAEDAVQEAFKSLQKHYQEKKCLPDKPIAFLVAAARKWIIKQRRDVRPQDRVSLDAVSSTTLGEVLDKKSPVRQPLEAVASTEIKQIADQAMGELDPEIHKIVALYKSSKTFAEIGAMLGSTEDAVRKRYKHAVHHVQAALGAHFSSFVTTAEDWVRYSINTRKSAEQAIDLLPPHYDEILKLRLIQKMTFEDMAEERGTTPAAVRRDYEEGLAKFHKMFRMTEDELLDVLFHGKQPKQPPKKNV